MKDKITIKSIEILDIFDKYKESLKLKDYDLSTSHSFVDNNRYHEMYALKVKIKSDYSKFEWKKCGEINVTIHCREDKNIVELDMQYSNDPCVLNNTVKLRIIADMVDELQAVDYFSLSEIRDYITLKDKERKLEDEKKEIEEKLVKQREEIEKKIEELSKD